MTVLPTRFAALPADLVPRIEAVDQPEVLDVLLERALTAAHPDDVRAAFPN